MINYSLKSQTIVSRAGTAIVAFALALMMIFASVVLAPVVPAAAATIVGTTGGLSPETISAGATGTLKISVAGANPYDDEPQDERPRGGVEGFTFTARRVADVDLTTMSGWQRAEEISLIAAKSAEFSDSFSAVTDANGTAILTGLPVGLYVVTATVPNDGRFTYKKPQDMVLTVPVGQVTEDVSMWQYDVEINAKYAPEVPVVVPPIPTPGGGGNDRTPPTRVPEEGVLDKQPTPEPGIPGEGHQEDVAAKAPVPAEGVLDKQLAETGASVIWMAGIAVLLILTGFILLASKRRDESSEVRS